MREVVVKVAQTYLKQLLDTNLYTPSVNEEGMWEAIPVNPKKLNDVRYKDESMYEIDNPYDKAKTYTEPEIIDYSGFTTSFNYPQIPNNIRRGYVKVHLPLGKLKTAATVKEIEEGLDETIKDRSKKVTVRLIDRPYPFEWEYMATSGNEKYEVSVRALVDTDNPDKKLVKGLDLLISCSCPYWQWQGPEHHAQHKGYLYGKPRGTASTPYIKDPVGINFLCKHAYKVLQLIQNQILEY